MPITVEIPEEVEKQLRKEFPDLDRRILEGFVAESFRRGDLSSAQVGQILGMQFRWEAIDFLSKRGVYPGYDLDDLEQDRRSVKCR